MTTSIPSIPKFFADTTIFITGSTGFLGKVILEKLLRSCPGIKRIYLIIRPQKGVSPPSRLMELTTLPLFDRLREQYPESFKKLVALNGDVAELKLGLSPSDYETLANEVNIIFHVAASVRFDDFLPEAIKMNTRGTREVLELALRMKNLQSVIHVSTTYCNCDKQHVSEVVYPAPANWETIIDIIEKIDPAAVNILTTKVLGTLPNTYTFSKALSEKLVSSYSDRLPVVIFRPSIVISSWKEPFPGWLDNINGPVSIMLGAGKGVIRTCLVDPDKVPDYMPVDVASKAIIAAVWQRAVNKYHIKKNINPDRLSCKRSQKDQVPVYNCSSMSKSISMRKLMVIGFDAFWRSPEAGILWIPTAHFCLNETWFFINCIFKHLLPALFVDAVLNLTGKKPMLLKLHRKIYRAMISLSFFTLREWKFNNDNFMNLNKLIIPEDKSEFEYDFADLDPKSFFENAMAGGRKYILKESEVALESAKTKAYRIYWLDLTIKVVSSLLFLWFLCKVIASYGYGSTSYF